MDLPGVEPVELSWSGSFALDSSRVFPDGSNGDVLVFEEVRFQGPGAAGAPSGLVGRAVELRSFPSRELLQVLEAGHLLGPDRHGDLLLPLWGALSPVIPDIREGATGAWRNDVPFMLDRSHGVRASLDLRWTHLGAAERGSGRAWGFSHSGALTGTGFDASDTWSARLALEGDASGEVWLRARDLRVAEHAFTWTATVDTRFSSAGARPEPRGTLRQVHTWVGWVRLDDAPAGTSGRRVPPRYLSEADILQVLHGNLEPLGTCFTAEAEPPRPAPLQLRIAGDGRVEEARVELDDAPAWAACVAEVARDLQFPPHDEVPETWRWMIAWRQGRVQPYPTAEVVPRWRPPLAAWLPQGADPDALAAALGVPSLAVDVR